MTDALSAARDYIERGWAPIPVPFRTKGPLLEDWQTVRINAETAPNYFNGAPQNIGIILGAASGGLCDLDLDCFEAIAAAPYLLPRTALFGHASKRASHWIYQSNLCETQDRAALKFMGSDKHGLLEVRMGARGLAAQTIFPPSVHVSGEPIEWEDGGPGKITDIDGDELLQHGRRLAAAAEIARNYPKVGGRHDAAFVLGGFLARCGFSPPGRPCSSKRSPRRRCSRATSAAIWRGPHATARTRTNAPDFLPSPRRSALTPQRRSPIGWTTKAGTRAVSRAPKEKTQPTGRRCSSGTERIHRRRRNIS